MKYGEIGAKPVEYLVLAWISGIGTALLLASFVAVIGVAYTGEFDSPIWQQALVGLLVVLLVAMTQLILAQTACSLILHSRSQRVPTGEAIGTGYRNSNIVVALPFETTDRSRFWVAMHNSGWRVFIAIYAVVLAVVVTSAAQNYVLGVLLLAIAVALGFWQALHVATKRGQQLVDDAEASKKQASYEKGLAARERKAARDLDRAATAEITEEWIERELKKAFTKTAITAVQQGDLTALDTPVRRAYVAMRERVPLDQLRERALEWASTKQP